MSHVGCVWRDGVCLWSDARMADRAWSRARGLLGRRAMDSQEALWIRPCAAVHTWGMGFPIDVVWLDGEGRILALREELSPWRWAWSGQSRVRDTLELAAGQIRERVLQTGQRLAWHSIP